MKHRVATDQLGRHQTENEPLDRESEHSEHEVRVDNAMFGAADPHARSIKFNDYRFEHEIRKGRQEWTCPVSLKQPSPHRWTPHP